MWSILPRVLLVWLTCRGLYVEATFGWFSSSSSLPPLTLPEECGSSVFVNGSDLHTTDSTEQNISVTDPTRFNIREIREAEFSWPWVVRLGDEATGVLISQQHVITLAHCIQNYTRWFGGYYDFPVRIVYTNEEVAAVKLQDPRTSPLPLAVLTLARNLTWHTPALCIGSYKDDNLPIAVGWNETGALLRDPVLIYRHDQCQDYFEEHYHTHFMLCGSIAPVMCGSPLFQVDKDRLIVVGLNAADFGTIASRYILLDSAREWLQKA